MLIDNGADLSHKPTWSGTNAIISAIYNENWEYADVLLAKHEELYGSNHDILMAADDEGETILHIAASEAKGVRMMEAIIKRLTPLERANFLEEKGGIRRITALHKAVQEWNFETAAYLLDLGASPFAADSRETRVGETFFRKFYDSRGSEDMTGKPEFQKMVAAFIFTPSLPIYRYLRSDLFQNDGVFLQRLLTLRALVQDEEGWDVLDFARCFGKQELVQKWFPDGDLHYAVRQTSWRERFKLPSCWNVEDVHDQAEFSEDLLTRSATDMHTRTRPTDGSARNYMKINANHPIPPYAETFYFEVEVLEDDEDADNKLKIGLTSGVFGVVKSLGRIREETISYRFCGSDGLVQSIEKFRTHRQYLPGGIRKFKAGDTVGCGYDQPAGDIFWTLNGKYLGIRFEGIRDRLYPAFEGTGKYKIRANFEGPFMWSQDDRVVVGPK
ncbi:hypothetical protein ABW19_dt0204055 [Dactylella cylindrospora]|nr:hypothetical protein ABW19_dt0204055 [Dactylella cylindrospora]